MSENNRTIRVKANILNESSVKVNLTQDFETLNILSLTIDENTEALYKTHVSNYGCIAGRVLANGGFGIPNAKISVFINRKEELEDDTVLSALYPYQYVNSKDDDNIRYNLLPEESDDLCYQAVGTFPLKRMVLDDKNMVEIFENYYTFTTRTNDSGDYMIFGVPTGNQTVHTDIDLSDCGILSQRPRDFIAKGYNVTEFESPNMFKKDTNLDSLPQIISENNTVDVLPFWGETSDNSIAITRCDVSVSYKFEPTCIFLGSVFTDDSNEGLSKMCVASKEMGLMSKLTTSEGTIEMIRKTMDDSVEEYQVNATELIDSDGVWCYQIPMNLDYITTDEYGNTVPTDDPEKGIPTRARVRFRISLTEHTSDTSDNHNVKVLVPNNPRNEEDLDYIFGTTTLDNEYGTQSFRDLFWNKIYTVKSFIPRFQNSNKDNDERFTGIKAVNLSETNNPLPYNNMRVNLSKGFRRQCSAIRWMIRIAFVFNRYFGRYITVGDGLCEDLENWYFCPGTKDKNLNNALRSVLDKEYQDPESEESTNSDSNESVCVTNKINYFMQCIEMSLAKKYNVIQFDFYNDWINGSIYIPKWYARVKNKKNYLLGLIKTEPKIEGCFDSGYGGDFRMWIQQCALQYKYDNETGTYTTINTPIGCKNNKREKCHTSKGRKYVKIMKYKGVVHSHKTYKSQYIYYLKPYEWMNNNLTSSLGNNNNTKRVPLFATDIVMLGSFDKCDRDGITNIIDELEESTFHLPSSIAQTNNGSEGYLYGFDGGYACNGTTDEGVTIPEKETFESYQSWSSRQDFADTEERTEYAVTESSGIDWTYHGPNQGDNSFSELFEPGGHFLGLSCSKTATNIKSCVNLSRICEIGVSPSRRRSIIINKGGEPINQYGHAYIVPNGFISKEDINKESFRSLFATMNYNGLKTKRDESTYRLKYDISYINPINFNGEMKDYVAIPEEGKTNPYNKFLGFDDWSDGGNTDSYAYNRAIEDTSLDYYYFRLGLGPESDKEEIKNKYLISNGSLVSLPAYENSFYFYFGLTKGGTALNKFFSDFSQNCPDPNEYKSKFTVEPDDENRIEICDQESGTTTATVDIFQMDGPYVIYLYKDSFPVLLSEDDENGIYVDNESGNTYAETYRTTFKLSGLGVGSYTIVIGGINTSSEEVEFEIKAYDPEIIENNIDGIIVTDFSDDINNGTGFSSFEYDKVNKSTGTWRYDGVWIYDETTGGTFTREKIGGYIELPEIPVTTGDSGFVGYIIMTSDGYKTNITDKDILTGLSDKYNLGFGETRKEYNFEPIVKGKLIPTVYEGNTYYYIYYVWKCDEKTYKMSIMKTVFCDMKYDVDLYFGNESVTYLKMLASKYGIKNISSYKDNWWKDDLRGYTERIREATIKPTDNVYLKDEKAWLFKRAIFYTGSLYDWKSTVMTVDYFNTNKNTDTHTIGPIFEQSTDDENFDSVIIVKRPQDIYSDVTVKDEKDDCEDINDAYIDGSNFHLMVVTGKTGSTCNFEDRGEVEEPDLSGVMLPSKLKEILSEKDLMDGTNIEISGDTQLEYTFNFSGETTGNTYATTLQSVYRPFYMNVFFIITNYDDNGRKRKVQLKARITNGISKDGKLGKYDWRIGSKTNPYQFSGSSVESTKKENYLIDFGKDTGVTMDRDYVSEIHKSESLIDSWYYDTIPDDVYKDKDTESAMTMEELYSYTNVDIIDTGMTLNDTTFCGSFRISDNSYDDNTTFSPETLTRTATNVHFLEDGELTSSKGVKYFMFGVPNVNPFSGQTVNKGTKEAFDWGPIEFTHAYTTYTLNDNLNQGKWMKMHTADKPNKERLTMMAPTYWQGVYTGSNPGFTQSYTFLSEIDPLEIASDIIKDKSDYSGFTFIGLYDDFTRNNDVIEYDQFGWLSDKRSETERFKNVIKHTSNLSVIRVYTYDEMKSILGGSEETKLKITPEYSLDNKEFTSAFSQLKVDDDTTEIYYRFEIIINDSETPIYTDSNIITINQGDAKEIDAIFWSYVTVTKGASEPSIPMGSSDEISTHIKQYDLWGRVNIYIKGKYTTIYDKVMLIYKNY